MSCVVIRNKKISNGLGFLMSDEARQRLKKHIIENNIQTGPPIIWPEGAVSAYSKHRFAPWVYTTKADIKRDRRDRMNKKLKSKRENGVVETKPAYVWTFFVSPKTFFGGWWLYIVGNGFEWGGKYHTMDCDIVRQVMGLFPFVDPVLFGTPDMDKWMSEFAKRFTRGSRFGTPMGKSPVLVEVKNNSIQRVLKRVEWPKNISENQC